MTCWSPESWSKFQCLSPSQRIGTVPYKLIFCTKSWTELVYNWPNFFVYLYFRLSDNLLRRSRAKSFFLPGDSLTWGHFLNLYRKCSRCYSTIRVQLLNYSDIPCKIFCFFIIYFIKFFEILTFKVTYWSISIIPVFK